MNFSNAHDRAVGQAVSLHPITAGGRFDPRLVRVRFVVDGATVGHNYLRVLPYFLVSIISPMLLTWLHINTTLSRRTTGEVDTGVWWGNLRERDQLEDLGVDGKIKMDLYEEGWGHGLDLSGSGQTQVAGSCECSNEHSVSTGSFLTG